MTLQSKPLSGAASRVALPGKIAFAFAVLTVVILACLPATGWLVRAQLRSNDATGQLIKGVVNPTPPSAERTAQVCSIVNANPDDFSLQLAAAWREEEGRIPNGSPEDGASHRTAQRVWQLRERFPDEPALYATYLRLNCMHGATGRAIEQELLRSDSIQDARASVAGRLDNKPITLSYWESHPRWLATMIEAAQSGEQLDPQNAYFPFVLASCYFAQKQDDLALAAIERAAEATYWNGYYAVETDGRLALSREEYGRSNLVAQIAVAAAQLFPDLANLRATARTATALAILREQQGDVEGGLHIRRSLSRTGALMRRDGGSVIGSLVGIAVVQIASTRPGGEPPIRKKDGEDDGKAARLRRAAYDKYLLRTGHSDEAQWFREETRSGEAIKDISRRGINRSVMSGVSLVWIGVWWSVCFIFLISSFWTLIGGGIGALVARGARVRDAAPLHVAARRALGVTPLAPVVGLLTALPFSSGGINIVAPLCVVVLLLIAPIFFLMRNPSGTGREMTRAQHRLEAVRSLKIYGKVVGLTLAVLAVIGGSVPLVFSGVISTVTIFHLMGSWGEGQDNAPFVRAGVFLIAVSVIGLSGLLLTLTTSLVWSVKRKVPASVGFALGFRSAALPVAAVLLLLYAGAVVQTSRVEAAADTEFVRMRQHEGRYLASLVNVPWPELVPDAVPAQKEATQ